MRPIAHPRDQTMLHRIDVTIFDVAGIIRFIPDEVFPKSPLPDTAFASVPAYMAQAFLPRERLCKSRLDQPPAYGKIGVSRRQRPNCVDMIRQHHHRINDDGVAHAGFLHGASQSVDMIDQEGFSAIKKIGGEEPATSRSQSE
jgi:hypothetical protein